MIGIDAEIKEIRRGKEKVRAICIAGDGMAEVLRPIPRHSLADEIVRQSVSERETEPACAANPPPVKILIRGVERCPQGGQSLHRKLALEWHPKIEPKRVVENCWKRHRKTKYKVSE